MISITITKQFEDIKGEITKTYLRLDEAKARIVGTEERTGKCRRGDSKSTKATRAAPVKANRSKGRESVTIYRVPEGAEGGPKSVISIRGEAA